MAKALIVVDVHRRSAKEANWACREAMRSPNVSRIM